jgi:hypothetical protein
MTDIQRVTTNTQLDDCQIEACDFTSPIKPFNEPVAVKVLREDVHVQAFQRHPTTGWLDQCGKRNFDGLRMGRYADGARDCGQDDQSDCTGSQPG